MTRLLRHASLVLAVAAMAAVNQPAAGQTAVDEDPYRPRKRSKGEKKRAKRERQLTQQ